MLSFVFAEVYCVSHSFGPHKIRSVILSLVNAADSS